MNGWWTWFLIALMLCCCGCADQQTPDPVPTPPVTMQLTGIPWSLVSYEGGSGEGVPVIEGTGITAYFDEGGELNGSAGCNHYTAMYATSGENMTIDNLVWTEMACLEPEGVMEQETAFLSDLGDVAAYEITASQLTMRDEEGNVMLEFMAGEE